MLRMDPATGIGGPPFPVIEDLPNRITMPPEVAKVALGDEILSDGPSSVTVAEVCHDTASPVANKGPSPFAVSPVCDSVPMDRDRRTVIEGVGGVCQHYTANL